MLKTVNNTQNTTTVDAEKITDPARIALLLEQLTKHYSPLTVQIAGHNEHYASCIVEIDKPYVLLDQLIPDSGHERLLETRKIHATGKIDGVDIAFSTTLEHVDEQDNLLTYHMKLPEKLKYQQRRMAYRVRIPLAKLLRVLIDNGGKHLIQGELHDLSHGGAGKIISSTKFKFKPGQWYECAIELPCGEWIYCTVEMCYLKNIPVRNRRLIGASFVGLTAMQSRIIGRCVSELELDQIRKRAGN